MRLWIPSSAIRQLRRQSLHAGPGAVAARPIPQSITHFLVGDPRRPVRSEDRPAREIRWRSGEDVDPVVDLMDTRGGPGGVDGLVVLRPGADRALERDRAVRRLDREPVGVELRVALEGLL